MIPKDIFQAHENHAVLQRAIEIAEKDYPKMEINIARDGGDVVELFLYDTNTFDASRSIVASYNMWYPDEMQYFTLKGGE